MRRGRGTSIRVRRATMIMASASGTSVPAIARLAAAAAEDTVRDVIHAFNERGLAALDPQWAGGRPRRITDDDITFIITTATARPETVGVPFTQWSVRKLAAHLARTPTKKILIGLTSHGDLGGLRPTGYYLSETAHMWKVVTEAGYTVELVSTAGGEPPVDGVDLTDPAQRAFTEDIAMAARRQATPTFAAVDSADYDAVLFAGGHGTMWDFPADEAGGVIGAVCHGPAALVGVTLSDGRPLVEGKQVSAFTDEEEAAVGLSEVVPFLLQTQLEKLGAKHTAAPDFQPHVVTDERPVTGQNPASATGVAQAVLAELER